jgi:leukotriene-A4 hydrolase
MATTVNPRDPNTLSNYNNWRSAHITANFEILFDQKKLVGNVVHKFRSTTEAQSKEIILDTSHLDIGEVKVDGQASKWELLAPLEPYGTPLKISLEKGVQLNETIEVDVRSPAREGHPLRERVSYDLSIKLIPRPRRFPSRPLTSALRFNG